MWDARTDPRTDQPVAVRDIGLTIENTTDAHSATSAAASDATLTLTPDAGFLTDPTTVYPVTIDPTQTLGALGDTFIQKSFGSNQGGSTELRAGTYNGGGDVARSLLKFDVTALKNRLVQSANLGLFNFHSWSCTKTWTDIREAGDFDPGRVTWSNQPWIGGIVANALAAKGYSSACGPGWVDFNMTGWAQTFADSRNNRPNVMPLAVQVGTETANDHWKKFNSGNAGGNIPALTFTFDGNCDQYAGHRVCGSIRDKWWQQGGPGGWLGLPTSSETAIAGGWFSHFQNGSIYTSANATIGTHFIRGTIRDRWAALGWERSYLGFPTTDEICGLRDGGCYNHFERGSIYWTAATGA
ncbi:DNRLRE domain-containing protein, partial [Modestobacter roseus]|uniref:DNRLRE domain-containing protein n=1 Tax=Modestobacter roseus TaxID=1181884 RepID=UPI001294D24B